MGASNAMIYEQQDVEHCKWCDGTGMRAGGISVCQYCKGTGMNKQILPTAHAVRLAEENDIDLGEFYD
jgi:DnaJ-class molecular chaperone